MTMEAEEQSDEILVQETLEGNQYAFERLVRRHQNAVFGLAMSMTRSHTDAADMAQEAFVQAYQKLDQFNPDYSFKTWLLKICANRTKNLFRSRVRRRNMEERHYKEVEIQSTSGGNDPDTEELEHALNRLPKKLKIPLQLKYLEGLSYDEISAVLKIGVSAAKMRVLRAKKQLAGYLKNE